MEENTVAWIVPAVIGAVLLIVWVSVLSRLAGLIAQVREARGTLAVQLQQRFDLIPDSLTAAREGVRSEMQYLMGILDTRRELAQPSAARLDQDLPDELRSVVNVMNSGGRTIHESNPSATSQAALYQQFMKTVASTEKDVTAARRFLEAAIAEYNGHLNTFPSFFIGRLHGFQPLNNVRLTNELQTKPNYFQTV